jgi:small nuclear ribonucleoprotein (snRNP)-like protein
VLVTAWSWTAFAGPEAWYEEGFGDCADKYFGGGDFRCNICGVEAGCDGEACFWGSVKANATNSGELSEALGKGFQMYCVNQGGAMLPTESPAGIQLRAADQAFRTIEADEAYVGGLPLSLGGALNFASGGVKGVAIPWSTGYASETSAFDMSGALLAGQGEGFHQFGLSLRPGLRFHTEPGTSETMSFLGLAAPGLLVVNGGDKLDTDVGYQVGGGLMGGVSFETGGGARLGAGVAADAAYAHAFRIPTQVLVRYWVPMDTGAFVVQPGVSLNPAAGGAIGDTVSVNGLAGLEWGEWVFGAQAFLQSDVKGGGRGPTHQGELARAVARGSLEEGPAGQGPRDEAFRPGDKVILTLKEGGEVRGTLTRYEPGQGYRVDLEDGSSRGLLWHEVSNAERDGGAFRLHQPVVVLLRDGSEFSGVLLSASRGSSVTLEIDEGRQTFAWQSLEELRGEDGVLYRAEAGAAPPERPARYLPPPAAVETGDRQQRWFVIEPGVGAMIGLGSGDLADYYPNHVGTYENGGITIGGWVSSPTLRLGPTAWTPLEVGGGGNGVSDRARGFVGGFTRFGIVLYEDGDHEVSPSLAAGYGVYGADEQLDPATSYFLSPGIHYHAAAGRNVTVGLGVRYVQAMNSGCEHCSSSPSAVMVTLPLGIAQD